MARAVRWGQTGAAMKTLIVGCGYLGLALGAEWVRRGVQVWGVRRTSAADEAMREAGIRPIHADVTRPGWSSDLPAGWDALVYCAAPGRGGQENYRAVYDWGVRRVLEEARRLGVRRALYTSSTGVYAAAGGEWVNEESPAEPADEKGRLLRTAELRWLEAGGSVFESAVIVRISGMYGAGRGYYLRRFLEGPAPEAWERERWVNQIHRDDVVSAVLTVLESAPSGRIYNVSDDEPARLGEIFDWLAARLGRGVPPPPAAAGALPARRNAGHKRVSNARLKEELHWRPRYPTYREGYAAELRRMGLWPGAGGGDAVP